MPKTYTEGHKAREITLAEAAIVKLEEACEKAIKHDLAQREKANDLRARAAAMDNKAEADWQRGEWDRKREAAEAHLAWLRAMPVPEEKEVTSDGVAD